MEILERNKIVEKHLGLVGKVVKKYSDTYSYLEYDDAFSIGCIGLIKAVETFDQYKGFKFSSYAGKCIANEVGMYLRSNKHDKNPDKMNLESPITSQDDGGEEITIVDVLGEDVDFISGIYLEELKSVLKPREKIVFELYFEHDLTQYTIAEMLNITQATVSRIIKRMITKYKKIYGGM